MGEKKIEENPSPTVAPSMGNCVPWKTEGGNGRWTPLGSIFPLELTKQGRNLKSSSCGRWEFLALSGELWPCRVSLQFTGCLCSCSWAVGVLGERTSLPKHWKQHSLALTGTWPYAVPRCWEIHSETDFDCQRQLCVLLLLPLGRPSPSSPRENKNERK